MQQHTFYFLKIVADCEYGDKENCKGISPAGCYNREETCCSTCSKLKFDEPGNISNLMTLLIFRLAEVYLWKIKRFCCSI